MLLWRDKPDPAALPSSWETHQRPPADASGRSRKESEGARDDKRDPCGPCGAMMPIKAMLERNECDDL